MITNPYASLAELQAYLDPRGQTIGTDAGDDALMSSLLDQAARTIDSQTKRVFYPRIETRYFSVPDDQNNNAVLYMDDDLLSVTTLTNGDTTVITSADYDLKSKNITPYWGIELKQASNYAWEPDGSGNYQDVISVLGVWGYRKDYSARGWLQVGTLGAAISSTSTLTLTMTAGHTLTKDCIIKIDNELFNVTNVSTNTVTVLARGDNGSTAATHLISAAVYQWQVQPEIKIATLQLATKLYQQRLGITTIFGTGGGKVTYPDFDLTMFVRII